MTIKELEQKIKDVGLEVTDFKVFTNFVIRLKDNTTLNLAHNGKLTVDGKAETVIEVQKLLGVE